MPCARSTSACVRSSATPIMPSCGCVVTKPATPSPKPKAADMTNRAKTSGMFVGSDIADAGAEVAGCSARYAPEPGKAGVEGSTPSWSTIRPTHCFELFRIIKRETAGQINFGECHFTFNGFSAELTDPHDDQRYRLTL